MLGVGVGYVKKKIRDGRLRAEKLRRDTVKSEFPTYSHKYRILRNDLIDFMVRGGMSLAGIRGILHDRGTIAVVGFPGKVRAAIGAEHSESLSGLFNLGQYLGEHVVSAIGIWLPAVGGVEACECLRGFLRQADRPPVLGVHYGDVGPGAALSLGFDSLIGNDESPGIIAERLRAMAVSLDYAACEAVEEVTCGAGDDVRPGSSPDRVGLATGNVAAS